MTGKNNSLRIKKILCPTDFSKESATAVRYSAELAKTYGATVYVCHHKSPSWWKAGDSRSANVENLNRKIETLLSHFGFSGFSQTNRSDKFFKRNQGIRIFRRLVFQAIGFLYGIL